MAPALGFIIISLVVLVLSPVVVIAGEFVNRHYLRGRLAHPFVANPVWIALTAPARWLLDRIRPRAGHGRRRGNGNGPPPAGVREPRRPRPDQPAGAMALPEPF